VRSAKLEFGKTAENAAVKFLKTKGYEIIVCNYRNKFGEIDIIARQSGVICFIEVKARHSSYLGMPQEAVGIAKQRQMSKVAVNYLRERHFLGQAARFDVVALLYADREPEISLITDAFELDTKFTV